MLIKEVKHNPIKGELTTTETKHCLLERGFGNTPIVNHTPNEKVYIYDRSPLV